MTGYCYKLKGNQKKEQNHDGKYNSPYFDPYSCVEFNILNFSAYQLVLQKDC